MVELIVQALANGLGFFCKSSWHWNCLVRVMVLCSVVELGMEVFQIPAASQLGVMSVARLARLSRIFRIAKLVKFLSALKHLIHSIVCTMKSLVWALSLVVLIVYVFGILFTDTVSSHLAEFPQPWVPDSAEAVLNEYFGSLHKSMHSLFRSITSGLTWYVAAEALASINWFWACLFTIYIAFSLFAVLNVMTGVFLQRCC